MSAMALRLERMALAPHARRAAVTGLAIFALDLAAYFAFVYAAVTSDTILLQLTFGVLAGAMVALLAIVGHDAAHNSFLPNRFLNELIGTIAFLPALHAFSLWEHHHNRVHHRYTAQIGLDNAYSPMTVEQYRAASPWRQRYYRFQRSLIGQQFFYLTDVWWPDIFMPFGGKKTLSRANLVDLAIVYLFIVAAVVGYGALALAAQPALSLAAAFATAAVFGVLVPFLVWNVFISFVTIVQHTGPAVRWFMPTGQPSTVEESMAGTVHIRLPNVLDWIMHRVMQHQAHHIHVGVPLYRLKSAQDDVGAASGQRNAQVWTPSYHLRLTRECKLYDHRRNTWCRFDAADAPEIPKELAA
jgi:acyl-lipid omega-6 desaturase (Delta-12 desaturase)